MNNTNLLAESYKNSHETDEKYKPQNATSIAQKSYFCMTFIFNKNAPSHHLRTLSSSYG